MKRHSLKTWPPFYNAIISGDKTFEARKNDRDFQVGDILELNEWHPGDRETTGRTTFRRVSYILHGGDFGVMPGYCIMGLAKIAPEPTAPRTAPNPQRSGPTADAASTTDVAGSADAKLLGADHQPERKP